MGREGWGFFPISPAYCNTNTNTLLGLGSLQYHKVGKVGGTTDREALVLDLGFGLVRGILGLGLGWGGVGVG